MPRRALGRSGIEVTALGLGGAAIAGLYRPVDEDSAAATVEAAWDVGIRYFDTAPHYGLGVSERRLGAVLRTKSRSQYVISTKVGRLLEPYDAEGSDTGSATGSDLANGFAVPATHRRVWDFSADGVRRSLEESLTRLGLDRIDLALIHDPDDHGEQAFHEAYPALERLRSEGMVGAIGAGMNQTAMLTRFLIDTDVDAVLCAGRYTLLEQPALAELLPAAANRGKSVIIGGVLNSGILAHPVPGATYNYSAAPGELLERALRMREVTEAYGVPLRAAALHFPFGHPAVASVLTGARSAAEVRDAATLLNAPVPADAWDRLRKEALLPRHVPVPEAR
ncbi:aldo/keto reductase [Streptomyces gilvosporeus]|uniref:Aldo/keto reductase n=1 Tax=Streptomyces gilvosporeus TaxID=553510 RepID=A0A1V0U2C3_9ACTN|nr:aldo/keto reductase [Streptomyces gilvosporeus]ARF59168.1 aldo/keto reductase [Streptomyces gilvosporeus]